MLTFTGPFITPWKFNHQVGPPHIYIYIIYILYIVYTYLEHKWPLYFEGFKPQKYRAVHPPIEIQPLSGHLDSWYRAWFPDAALPVFAMELQTIVKAKEVAGLL